MQATLNIQWSPKQTLFSWLAGMRRSSFKCITWCDNSTYKYLNISFLTYSYKKKTFSPMKHNNDESIINIHWNDFELRWKAYTYSSEASWEPTTFSNSQRLLALAKLRRYSVLSLFIEFGSFYCSLLQKDWYVQALKKIIQK